MSKEAILLLGSYGRGNIGDDAFLLAASQLFKGHTIYINSSNDALLPAAVRNSVTTIATSGGKDLRHKLAVFRRIRHIVYCGGDLWVELYGDRLPRQSLYKMVAVNLVARLCGKKVHYLGCGIGPLKGYSLFLARLSARLANSIVVREPRSASVLGLQKIRVLPDLVTTLGITPPAAKTKPGTYTIGVSILYHLPDPGRNFPKLVQVLTEVLGRLPAKRHRIVLFPMLVSPDESHDDAWASTQLQQALPQADIQTRACREVDDFVAALGEIDLLIGTRLHANVIALLAGVPVLGIAYRPKVAQFFAMQGLEAYCINLDELTAERLESQLQTMRAHHRAVARDIRAAKERLTAAKGKYQDFVATQF